MSAGTITLTNNSDAVTGTGTTFNTELVSGDFVVAKVGGITYTLPIKSVDNDTQITLISKYPGPTQANSAWNAVPRATQNLVTAALVAQTTEALRGLNYDKANWQAVFSDSGDITVMLPDGSTFSGPSWNKIAQLLADIDQVALQALADQVNADAQQVAADRLDVDSKAQQVHTDAQTASTAAGTATTANTAAQQAKTDAVTAKTQAEAARDAAQSANPDNQLKKAQNLADLPDKSAARGNLDLDAKAYIRGLSVTISATQVVVDVGAAALPSSGDLVKVTSAITQSIGTTVQSTWYHIYLYSNSGTPAIEISTTAPVAYAWPAYQKTGDTSRRYLGSFIANASNVVSPCRQINGRAAYLDSYFGHLILNGGTATADTSLAISSHVPVTALSVSLETLNNTTQDAYLYSLSGGKEKTIWHTSDFDLPIRSYPNIYYRLGGTVSSGGFFVDIMGYTYAR